MFLDKSHQLYEMILVRHGLMLVGYSYGAKTSIYRALAGALADLEAAGLMEEHRWGLGSERGCLAYYKGKDQASERATAVCLV